MKEFNENEEIIQNNDVVSGNNISKVDKKVPEFENIDQKMEYANGFRYKYHVASNDAILRSFQGDKYKGYMSQFEVHKNTNISIDRTGGHSIAILALLLEKDENGNPKYTYEQICDPKALVEEKQKAFDTVVQAAIRGNDEDNKFLCETIINGLKVGAGIVEKYTRQLNLDDPNYECSETFNKIAGLVSLMHDAWQELDGEYSKEQLEFAQKENPNIKTEEEAHKYVLDKYIGFMSVFASSQNDIVNGYYKIKNNDAMANPLSVASDSFMVHELKKVLRDWRENENNIPLSEYSLSKKGRTFYHGLNGSIRGYLSSGKWRDTQFKREIQNQMVQYGIEGKLFDGSSFKIKNNEVELINPPILDFDNNKIKLPKPVKKKVSKGKSKAKTKTDINDKKLKEAMAAKAKVDAKYNEYLVKHTGEDVISDDMEKNADTLSRAMAASMLGKSKAVSKYSESRIEDTAKRIREVLRVSEMDNNAMKIALQKPEYVEMAVKVQVKSLYVPQNSNKLINDMKKLGDNMMSDKGRTTEYQNLVTAVKNLGKLSSDKENDPVLTEQTTAAGYEVLRAVENYTKGKKSIRFSDDGKDRFDNALDALGILYKHLPRLRPQIDIMVERINIVRKSQDPAHKNHVDINKYGADRAEQAMKRRSKKAQDVKKQPQRISVK